MSVLYPFFKQLSSCFFIVKEGALWILLSNYRPPLAGAALIFPAGAFVGARWFAPALTRRHDTVQTIAGKPAVVQGKETVKTETQIAYAPKETVIEKYIDSDTGNEVMAAKPENTDLDAQVGNRHSM